MAVAIDLVFSDAMPADKGLWAKCVKCAHCWVVVYYPMNVQTLVRVAKGARCPKCGAPKPLMAKQTAGVLQEPDAPTPERTI